MRHDAPKTPMGALVVTGGGRGIGAAICRLAGTVGRYDVCVNYLDDADSAGEVVRAIVAEGGRAMAIQGDVSNPEDVQRLFAQVGDRLGPLAGLVNNAGISGARQPLENLDVALLKRVLDVNVVGAFLCAREAVKRMIPLGRGAIVNISSQSARFGGFQLTPYAASKAAIDAFTVGLAREVAPAGLRVNGVSPGIIDTQGYRMKPGETLQDFGIPMGRKGQPMEVAEAVVWLLSDQASYVSGAVLPIAGGR